MRTAHQRFVGMLAAIVVVTLLSLVALWLAAGMYGAMTGVVPC